MNTRKALTTLVLCAIFIALSYALSNVKIFSTIAFDSFPAFLAALILGTRYGAVVGFLGHIFTSLLGGFPLSIPVHLIIAVFMAVCVFVFGAVYGKLAEKNRAFACGFAGVLAVAINGPIEIFALSPLIKDTMGGWAGLIPFMGILTIAAAANVVIAFAVYMPLARRVPALLGEKRA